MSGKRSLILLLVVSLIICLGLGLCGCEKYEATSSNDEKAFADEENLTDKQKDEKIVFRFENNPYTGEERIQSMNKHIERLYADNPEKQEYWKSKIKEMENEYSDTKISESWDNDPLFALQIQDGHKYTVNGDYCYVNGKVKNRSDKPIKYFEVTINYLDDNGNVLDSDYTNSGQTLYPEDMKEFEIMHKNNSEYKKYELKVTTVNFE